MTGFASAADSIRMAGDDHVVPFEVSPLDIRGRAVQLDAMLNSILSRHDYPAPVASLLGEVIVLTVLLGTSLKFDGKFIIQTQTNGPVSLLVTDFKTPHSVRAYARFDEAAVAAAEAAGTATPQALLGNGIMAMTIDQGPEMQRYQGIVALDGTSLEEIARQYFRQSEQIPTEVRLAVAGIVRPGPDGGPSVHSWRAGGLMVQFLPESLERMRMPDLPGGDAPDDGSETDFEGDDAWNEARALVETVAVDELTDPQIGSERLLFRLFHEHGVRIFEPVAVQDECSCSRERIVELIRSFSEEDRQAAAENGVVTTTCEFCSAAYEVSLDEL
ncbi:MAG: Hsp33 family molecular chaperone [Nitratireductor sp.]|nr:Hsp33 family molecular chaperone [Nitratireductor sp.]